MSEPELSLDEAKAVIASTTAPRVTEESIRAKIADVRYLREEVMTVCFIVMRNGFVFVGTSAPASPENYDPEVGKRYAYDNAFKQIWPHEGYLLRELLSGPRESF